MLLADRTPMNEQILINVTPQETRVAVTEQGAVQELHIERDSSRGLVGNIYLGRVCRVLPGMQSAFVEIGLPRAAFLHVADIWGARTARRRAPDREDPLRRADAARAGREGPIGSKGARLSTQVSIAGRCWSTCRRTRTSASRSGSRTRPSAST
jgi:ribonuclease G